MERHGNFVLENLPFYCTLSLLLDKEFSPWYSRKPNTNYSHRHSMTWLSITRWKQSRVGGSLLALSLFALMLGPVWVFGGAKNIYVDKDNKGSEDGSKDHPYHTIDRALHHAKKGNRVFVAKGTYKENITVPQDVTLVGGKSKGDVIIAGDNDAPTITMKNDSEVQKMIVKGGRHGIRVEEEAKAKIIHVTIKESRRDGIHIDKGSLAKRDEVYIEDTEIKGSTMAGIFSNRRSVVVIDTDINHNGDGVDFTAGVKAWFKDARVNDNRGSGLKLTLDGANFWSRDLSVRRNGREGVEVNAYGGSGNIGFKETVFIDNGRYAIARNVRGNGGEAALKNIFLEEVRFDGNRLGKISAPLWSK